MSHDSGKFRKVMDLCDQLNDIRDRLARRRGDGTTGGKNLLDEKHDKLGQLWDQLDGAFQYGALGEIRERFGLTREELMVTALLLARRIRSGHKGLSGRAILSLLYDSTYEMIRAMDLLASQGNLRQSGIVVEAEAYLNDVLDSSFRISDEMYYVIVDEIGDGRAADSAAIPLKSFESARDHLLEMGRLSALYRKRAAALFPVEAQDFFAFEGSVNLDELDYRIDAGWTEIEQRLLLTPRYEEFPLVRMERKYGVSREELVMVVALFFVELVSPAPYLVVGDLLKLVSRSEEELMSRRGMLREDASLVGCGIVMLNEDHGVHGKLTTFDAYLADWVVDELTGPATNRSEITTDMQIDVHEFLKGISLPGEPGSSHKRKSRNKFSQ